MDTRDKMSEKSTGPKTPEGKENSSQNSTKHGLRAKKLVILPDESQEDYDGIEQGWRDEFEPEGYQEERLVNNLVFNDWLLMRAQRRVMEVEAAIGEEGLPTAERQHELELMLRYKTTVERAFYRAWEALRGLRKDIMRDRRETEKLGKQVDDLAKKVEERTPPPVTARVVKMPNAGVETAVFQGQNHVKRLRKVAILDQWVEVTVKEGRTLTKLFPSNEKLMEEGKAMLPAPDLVYRRFDFVNGVPPEYEWVTEDEQMRKYGGSGIQRMTVERWLEAIEYEKADGTGHLGPCGGNLPRPKQRGGCDCPVCTYNRELLEKVAG